MHRILHPLRQGLPLALALLSPGLHAESMPAQQVPVMTGESQVHYEVAIPNAGVKGATPAIACTNGSAAVQAHFGHSGGEVTLCSPPVTVGGGGGVWRHTWYDGFGYYQGGMYMHAGCLAPDVPINAGCGHYDYGCPAVGGWTLVGDTCERCAEGYFWDALSTSCLPEKDFGEACR